MNEAAARGGAPAQTFACRAAKPRRDGDHRYRGKDRIRQSEVRPSGYSADEVIGKTPRVVNSGLTPPDVYVELWSTIRSGATWRGALRNRRRDGTLYWEDTWISPLMGDDGRIVNFIAVKEDITQRIEAEEALCRLNVELEERIRDRTLELEAANRELEAFSSSVSHDLRAPLTSIQRFAEALLESSAPVTAETSRHYLERISAAGQRMQDLIDDLLGWRVSRRRHSMRDRST